MDNFPKAYKEVYEILKYIPKEDIEKIPKDFLQTIEDNMDKEYIYKIDENKSFEEQETLKETKAIISIIYKEYWATPERKQELIEIRREQRNTLEQEKMKKYDSNIVFRQKDEQMQETLAPISKKDNFIARVLKKIKGMFG